jgi:hypothetical protein
MRYSLKDFANWDLEELQPGRVPFMERRVQARVRINLF